MAELARLIGRVQTKLAEENVTVETVLNLMSSLTEEKKAVVGEALDALNDAALATQQFGLADVLNVLKVVAPKTVALEVPVAAAAATTKKKTKVKWSKGFSAILKGLHFRSKVEKYAPPATPASFLELHRIGLASGAYNETSLVDKYKNINKMPADQSACDNAVAAVDALPADQYAVAFKVPKEELKRVLLGQEQEKKKEEEKKDEVEPSEDAEDEDDDDEEEEEDDDEKEDEDEANLPQPVSRKRPLPSQRGEAIRRSSRKNKK